MGQLSLAQQVINKPAVIIVFFIIKGVRSKKANKNKISKKKKKKKENKKESEHQTHSAVFFFFSKLRDLEDFTARDLSSAAQGFVWTHREIVPMCTLKSQLQLIIV